LFLDIFDTSESVVSKGWNCCGDQRDVGGFIATLGAIDLHGDVRGGVCFLAAIVLATVQRGDERGGGLLLPLDVVIDAVVVVLLLPQNCQPQNSLNHCWP
jgi:hypothetical protein